ncbi:MAG TPA: NADPH-dependent F420 reductase [Vicinamibacterales bacterium]
MSARGGTRRAGALQPADTQEAHVKVKTIGLIGAGHIGSQVARLAVRHGYDVVLSNSRGPETLKELVNELGPHARAATPLQAAEAGDLVVVTIPLKNIGDVPAAPLAGKIVIDTNNYYPQRDGHIAELDEEKTTTAELLQRRLPNSKVVKAFNHIYAAELTTHGQPAGTANRRALAIAGNDAEAKRIVAELIDTFGFDVVDMGPLSESWRIQRDTPGYGPRRTADELRRDLAAAVRPPRA